MWDLQIPGIAYAATVGDAFLSRLSDCGILTIAALLALVVVVRRYEARLLQMHTDIAALQAHAEEHTRWMQLFLQRVFAKDQQPPAAGG